MVLVVVLMVTHSPQGMFTSDDEGDWVNRKVSMGVHVADDRLALHALSTNFIFAESLRC